MCGGYVCVCVWADTKILSVAAEMWRVEYKYIYKKITPPESQRAGRDGWRVGWIKRRKSPLLVNQSYETSKGNLDWKPLLLKTSSPMKREKNYLSGTSAAAVSLSWWLQPRESFPTGVKTMSFCCTGWPEVALFGRTGSTALQHFKVPLSQNST